MDAVTEGMIEGVSAEREAIEQSRISEVGALVQPGELLAELALSPEIDQMIRATRSAIRDIVHGRDPRLLVVVGPCSIHDVDAALAYARWLVAVRDEWKDELVLLMRAYVEKPRTRLGWKGLVNDPELSGAGSINSGLRTARRLLLDIGRLGLPVATEFVELTSPQFLGDLVSWAAIGARTTESQPHRQMVSGMAIPTGFKNTTDGNIASAVNAVVTAAGSHHFVSLSSLGHATVVTTRGNPDCHIVLRGGHQPNYRALAVEAAGRMLSQQGRTPRVMIDCSHGNAAGNYRRQLDVAADVGRQVAEGSQQILGVMVESNLVEGAQSLAGSVPLQFGQSVTDPCLGPEDTRSLLNGLADAVRRTRLGPHVAVQAKRSSG